MASLIRAVTQFRANYAELRATDDDSGMEILQAVILGAGLAGAAVVIVAAVTGAINGWISKIPL